MPPAGGGRRRIGAGGGPHQGVTRATARHRANREAFPAIRYRVEGLPPTYRFVRASIAAFLERSRISPTGANGGDDHEPADG